MKYIIIILLFIAATCEVQPPRDCTTYDTIPVYKHDTIVTEVFDTTRIQVNDTTIIWQVHYDTIRTIVYDTVLVEIKYDEIDSYYHDANHIGLQYIGAWTKMEGKGNFANKSTDTLRIRFWGQRIKIDTEMNPGHKAYKVFLDKKLLWSVPVYNDVHIPNITTFEIDSIQPLQPKNHNHIIELVPDGGYFVFNGYEVYFWPNPNL